MKRLLPFLLLLISSATLAESGAYRVEVIVFRHLKAETEATAIEELRSFSQIPDIVETEQIEEPGETLPADSTNEHPVTVGGAPRGDLPNDLHINDLHILAKRTTYMDDAWRRLRSSKDYRPLVYAAWEQNRIDYYPPMRIHDQNIIDRQLRPPTNIMVADLAAADPLAAYRSTFYQLDGSVQLRRSRFLHLFLDLEYREPKPETAVEPGFFAENDNQTEVEADTDSNKVQGVFTLRQNRQIRTGKVQYFDTPFFGALVFVSAIPAK